MSQQIASAEQNILTHPKSLHSLPKTISVFSPDQSTVTWDSYKDHQLKTYSEVVPWTTHIYDMQANL